MPAGLPVLLNQLLRASDASFKEFLNGPSAKVKPFIDCLVGFCAQMAYCPGDLSHFEPTAGDALRFLYRLCPQRTTAKKAKLNPLIAPKRFVDLFFDERSDILGLVLWLWRMKPGNSEIVERIKAELFPLQMMKKITSDLPAKDAQLSGLVEWLRGPRGGPDTLSNREREAILQRFEFDSDDDLIEEDDQPTASNELRSVKGADFILLKEYARDATVFARTSTVRHSKARAALLRATEMTHEQLEGWAIMFERNPRKLRILSDFALNLTKEA